ncbi:MAG: hypothetical protein JO162_03430 [Alphaproteobacteria bacterium]|nr:hypothetical protein [Alphaproteobacteria bacterium]
MPDKNPRPKGLAARLDRAAGDLNAFLLVLAIGLATLDLTCFWAFKMRDALPSMALTTSSSAAVNPSNAPQPKKAEASRPNAPKVGW